MGYRLPPVTTVEKAVRRVLAREGGAGSLVELHREVERVLRSEEPAYRLGVARLRRIVSRMNAVTTTIRARRGGPKAPKRECPVCGAAMESLRNRTLDGAVVEVDVRCTACPYWTGRDRRVPARYGFHLRRWRFAEGASRPRSVDRSTRRRKRL